MASPRYEVYTIHTSHFSIDNNGGFGSLEVSCALRRFCDYVVRPSVKYPKSVVSDLLHHSKFAELLIGLQNVFQITQVRTQP